MTIEQIVSPSGIKAWLVREHTVPLVALSYSFHGGSTQDDPDKAGTANLAADMLDEGAGDLDGKTFHERLESHAIELSLSAPRAIISAARCARSTRTATRPSTCCGSRCRSRVSTPTRSSACAARNWPTWQRELVNPNSLAADAWWSAAFPGHPYGRESNGTPDTMQRITADDMRDYVHARLRAQRADHHHRRRCRRRGSR